MSRVFLNKNRGKGKAAPAPTPAPCRKPVIRKSTVKECKIELVHKRTIPVPAMTEYEEALATGAFVGTFEQYQRWKAQFPLDLVQDELDRKANKVDLDALAGRVTTSETQIIQNAEQIALKASKEVVDHLEGRVTVNESSLIVQADLIATKVSQTEFDHLGNKVGEQETRITQNSEQIALKAEKSVVDDLTGRVAESEAQLIVQAGLIESKVSQTEFNSLGVIVGQQGTSISQNSADIVLRATKSEFDALGVVVGQQGTSILQNSQQIELRATKSEFDALGNRVTTAESSITQNSQQIALRVTQGEIESQFTMTPNKISLFGKTLDMTGQVTFSSLDQSTQKDITTIDGSRIVTGSVTADKLSVGTLTARVIQTAEVGERYTVGFMPTDTSDPTSSAPTFSRHGPRTYHPSGRVASYVGHVRNFTYETEGITKTVDGHATIVFKDEVNSPVFYVLDSTSTGGIQYVTVTPNAWFRTPMRYINTVLNDTTISNALNNPNSLCGDVQRDGTEELSVVDVELKSNEIYYYFRPGSASTESPKMTLSEYVQTPIPDGWYLTETSFDSEGKQASGDIWATYSLQFSRYVNGVVVEAEYRSIKTTVYSTGDTLQINSFPVGSGSINIYMALTVCSPGSEFIGSIMQYYKQ